MGTQLNVHNYWELGAFEIEILVDHEGEPIARERITIPRDQFEILKRKLYESDMWFKKEDADYDSYIQAWYESHPNERAADRLQYAKMMLDRKGTIGGPTMKTFQLDTNGWGLPQMYRFRYDAEGRLHLEKEQMRSEWKTIYLYSVDDMTPERLVTYF